MKICKIKGCDKKVHARDLCHIHYNRWHLEHTRKTCVICGDKAVARDFCPGHYHHKWAKGEMGWVKHPWAEDGMLQGETGILIAMVMGAKRQVREGEMVKARIFLESQFFIDACDAHDINVVAAREAILGGVK